MESFKKKLKLWLNMIAEGNNEMFQSYSDYIMEADDFYSQSSVSDIIAAHLKMLLLFEKYYPEHEDPRRQNMWTCWTQRDSPFPWRNPYSSHIVSLWFLSVPWWGFWSTYCLYPGRPTLSFGRTGCLSGHSSAGLYLLHCMWTGGVCMRSVFLPSSWLVCILARFPSLWSAWWLCLLCVTLPGLLRSGL